MPLPRRPRPGHRRRRRTARLAALLTDVDEFLRCGNGVAERLADFYATRGDPHPRFAAATLIDAVSFTTL
ncbi:MAG: hypothetical protein GEV07_30570 [Streptosporangiales bacterium]|nr:hypothetical protein [Streptosporangiales bacterium]